MPRPHRVSLDAIVESCRERGQDPAGRTAFDRQVADWLLFAVPIPVFGWAFHIAGTETGLGPRYGRPSGICSSPVLLASWGGTAVRTKSRWYVLQGDPVNALTDLSDESCCFAETIAARAGLGACDIIVIDRPRVFLTCHFPVVS